MRALCAILLLAAAALGQEPVFLRTEQRPEGEAWVGQRVSFYVTVVMAGRPSQSPRFDLPRVDGALLLQSPGSPVLGTEAVDGTEYTSQRFELMLFAQRADELEIPPVHVRVTLGDDEHALETDPFQLRARLPDGVEPGTPLITTRDLSIEESWDPQPSDTTVGSAFVRTITIQARNVLGLAIPPVPLPEIEGLTAYPSDPVVDDKMTRGALESTRTDRLTLVCSQPGTYELPALVYTWWNPEALRLERRELPGLGFTVRPDANATAERELGASSSRRAWPFLLSLVLLGVPFWFVRRRLAREWRTWRRRSAESEPALFRRLQRACHGSDAQAAWAALLAWIDRSSRARQVPVVQEFASTNGFPELAAAAEEVQRALLEEASWSGSRLARAATEARRGGPPERTRIGGLPASLNPGPAARRRPDQG